jgi:acetyl esterase/lipase
MPRTLLIGIVALFMLVVTARAVDVPAADVEFTPDVIFGKGGGEDLTLNLARPTGRDRPLPCVVFIHGGAWRAGERGDHDKDVREMARRGFVAASVDYRLAPEHRFPAQVHDVKCAIRFLRAHAGKYGLDPEHIAVWGVSVGGHLALMLGVTQKADDLEGDGGWPEQSSAVQAAVAYYPRTDLAAGGFSDGVRKDHVNFLGGSLAEVPEQYRKASPLTYLNAGDAPMLILQGTADPRVPLTQTFRMLDAMTKAKVSGRVELVAGAGHGWSGEERRRSDAAAIAFIQGKLAAAPTPPAVQFTRDVVYGKGGDQELKLNIARPAGDAKNRPCIVFVHGGGWQGGDRAAHDGAIKEAALRGYVSATVGYRLAPKHKFPSQVNDVKCAIRFLRAHADEYGLDPDRIGACGFSAGGHLVMMLGVTGQDDGLEGDGGWAEQSSRVQAVVSFFGPADLAAADLPAHDRPLLVAFLGGSVEEKRNEYDRASPITYVTKGDAPMLLIQGTADVLVPHTQAYRMVEAMTKAGVPGRADLIAGANHGWFNDAKETVRTGEETFAFFQQYLKRPDAATRPTP